MSTACKKWEIDGNSCMWAAPQTHLLEWNLSFYYNNGQLLKKTSKDIESPLVYTFYTYRVVRQWWIIRKPAGNLRKLAVKVSGRFPNFFISTSFFLIFFVSKKIRKPAGNRRGRFPEVSRGFRIIHHWRTTRYTHLFRMAPNWSHFYSYPSDRQLLFNFLSGLDANNLYI